MALSRLFTLKIKVVGYFGPCYTNPDRPAASLAGRSALHLAGRAGFHEAL